MSRSDWKTVAERKLLMSDSVSDIGLSDRKFQHDAGDVWIPEEKMMQI
jgi:hypothetical protein